MKTMYINVILSLLLSLLIFSLTNAQETLEDEINKIEDSVDKIIITSNGIEYSFEGDEAKELFQKMKKGSSKNLNWTMSYSENGNKKLILINEDGQEKIIEIDSEDENEIIIKIDKDPNSDIKGIKKKVKVEIEDGNKKVTVTTKENGEEKTEVYEGKGADEYLEKMKSENDDIDIMIKKDGDDKKVKKIIIKTDKDEELE